MMNNMRTLFENIFLDEAYRDLKNKLSKDMRGFIFDVSPENKVGKYGEWIANTFGQAGDDGIISLRGLPITPDQLAGWLEIFDKYIQGDIKDYNAYTFQNKVESYIEEKKIKQELKQNPAKHIENIINNSEYRIDLVKTHYGAKWYDRHIDPGVDSACTWCVGKSQGFWDSQSDYGKLYFIYIQNKRDQVPHNFFAVRYYPNGKLKDIFNNASPNTNSDKIAKEKAVRILDENEDAVKAAIKNRTHELHSDLIDGVRNGSINDQLKAAELLNPEELHVFFEDPTIWINIEDYGDLEITIAKNIDDAGLMKIKQTAAYSTNSKLKMIVGRRLGSEGAASSLSQLISLQFDRPRQAYYFDIENWGENPISYIVDRYGNDSYSWYQLEHNTTADEFEDDAEEILENYFNEDDKLSDYLVNILEVGDSFNIVDGTENQPVLPGMEDFVTGGDSGLSHINTLLSDPERDDENEELKKAVIAALVPYLRNYIYDGMRDDVQERFFDGLSSVFEAYEDAGEGHRIFLNSAQIERLDEHIELEAGAWEDQSEEDYMEYLDSLDPNEFIKDFIEKDYDRNPEDYNELAWAAIDVATFRESNFYNNEEFAEYVLNVNYFGNDVKTDTIKAIEEYMQSVQPERETYQTFESYLRKLM